MPKSPPPVQPASLQRQPRSLSQEASIQPEKYFATPLWAELQRFGKKVEEVPREVFQHQLFETRTPDEIVENGIFGLSLDSVPETKAFDAVRKILADNGFTGSEEEIAGLKSVGFITTWPQYFEAYGLKKIGGRHTGKTRTEAVEALMEGLTRSRFFGFEFSYFDEKGKNKKRIFRQTMPLVSVADIHEDLSDEEAEQVKDGQTLPHKVKALKIVVSPILLQGIKSFSVLIPDKLFQELEDHHQGKRPPLAVINFIYWLLTKNTETVTVSRETLATRLKLHGYIRQRKPRILEERFKACFEVAMALGFLLEFSEDGFGNFVLRLNSERCKRVKAKKALPCQEATE